MERFRNAEAMPPGGGGIHAGVGRWHDLWRALVGHVGYEHCRPHAPNSAPADCATARRSPPARLLQRQRDGLVERDVVQDDAGARPDQWPAAAADQAIARDLPRELG